MRQLSLLSVRMQNFRSFVEDTTVDMSGPCGLRLITGSNLAEPRLGANGIGKSTIFDALCFCLYGTSIRGLRASDLISRYHLTTEASVTLRIDDREVTIRRTAPPARVFIANERAEDADVERLVGLSRTRFLNSVVFGQAVPLFLDLPAPARGDLLDEVLDLELWMRAAKLAGSEHVSASGSLNKLRVEMASTQGQMDGLPDLAYLKSLEADWDQAHAELVDAANAAVKTARRDHEALKKQARTVVRVADTTALQKAYEDAQHNFGELREQRASVRTEVVSIEEDLKFFEENDECPSCGQTISEDFVQGHLEEMTAGLSERRSLLDRLDADVKFTDAALPVLRASWQKAVQDNAARQRDVQLLDRQMRDKVVEIERMVVQAKRLASEINPYATQRQQVSERRRALRLQLRDRGKQEASLLQQMTSLDYWRGGFRKVRLFCLDRVLRELEIETQNVLCELGLLGWGIIFKTATETKAGTVKLGVQVEIKSPSSDRSFDMMSPGEQQRARLAVSLGLANLIQRWAGVRWSVEVLDEPTNWLSEQGVEDLLETLSSRASSQRRSIWLCDHRALSAGSFLEVMQVVKDERHGSRIQ